MKKYSLLIIYLLTSIFLVSCVSTNSFFDSSKIVEEDLNKYELNTPEIKSYGLLKFHDFDKYKIELANTQTIYLQKYYILSDSECKKYYTDNNQLSVLTYKYYTKIDEDRMGYVANPIKNLYFYFIDTKDGKLQLKMVLNMPFNNKKYASIFFCNQKNTKNFQFEDLSKYDADFILDSTNIDSYEDFLNSKDVYISINGKKERITDDMIHFILTYIDIYKNYSNYKNEFYQQLIIKFGEKDAEAIINGYSRIGMSEEAYKYMRGSPDHVNTSVYSWTTQKQYVYESKYTSDTYVYFENGKLTSIQY